MAGTSDTAAQSSSTGQQEKIKSTSQSLWSMLTTLLSGENQTINRLQVAQNWNSTHVTAATTTVVRSGAGVLGGICVNTTAAGTITVYDNTAASGTVLGVIKASVLEGKYMEGIPFGTGLTIVTAGASDLSVLYLP